MFGEYRFETHLEAIRFLQDQKYKCSGASNRWVRSDGAVAVCVVLHNCTDQTVVVISALNSPYPP